MKKGGGTTTLSRYRISFRLSRGKKSLEVMSSCRVVDSCQVRVREQATPNSYSVLTLVFALEADHKKIIRSLNNSCNNRKLFFSYFVKYDGCFQTYEFSDCRGEKRVWGDRGSRTFIMISKTLVKKHSSSFVKRNSVHYDGLFRHQTNQLCIPLLKLASHCNLLTLPSFLASKQVSVP